MPRRRKNSNEKSGITNGHPWTKDDNKLVSDLPLEYQEKLLFWVKQNIVPRKTCNIAHSSRRFKKFAEEDTGICITNNQIKDAMLLCGFHPHNPDDADWYFCVSQQSPCIQRRMHSWWSDDEYDDDEYLDNDNDLLDIDDKDDDFCDAD